MKKLQLSLLATTVALSFGAAKAQQEVEVLHWWTAGGEAAALGVLKDNLESQGIGWKDMPVAGGGGDEAMTVLQARVQSGQPPTSVQMLGFDIQDWAADGDLANLNDLAAEEDWDAVIPAAIQRFSKYDGNWVAAPVNVHSTNWVWANKSVLDKAGVSEAPTTWDGFVDALQKVQDAGFVALAHGGQDWQDATIFDGVVLSTGGPEFYKKAMIELDEEALTSETMAEAFERMRTLRQYVDSNFSGREWNTASAMVINGEAGFQIMGDWAKGEFLRADMQPNEDFLCFRVPGTQGSVTFNSDQFTMFQVGEDKVEAQKAMARAVESPEFQIAFNKVKGSVPARTDIDDADFDACGQKGMADVAEAAANGNLMGSMGHGHAAPAAVKSAVLRVVTEHFNSDMSGEEAADKLASQIQLEM